jgi:excisionase family DNA binding protein
MTSPFKTPQELSAYLGVSLGFIYERTQRGAVDVIPHIKMGRLLRFDVESEAFKDWLRRRTIEGVIGFPAR